MGLLFVGRKSFLKSAAIKAVVVMAIFCNPCYSDDWSNSRVLDSRMIITVLNENKIIVDQEENIIITKESDKKLGYDGLNQTKYQKLLELKAIVYDSTGEKIKKLEKEDIQESSVSYNAIYSEHKSVFHLLSNPTLPYRIFKQKKYEIKSAFFWPAWDPQRIVDVTRAQLDVVIKEPIDFEFIPVGEIDEPYIYKDSEGFVHYRWSLENVPAFKNEYQYAPEDAFQIGVKFIPKKFNLDGYRGSSENWKTFGDWVYQLFEDQIVISSDFNDFDEYASISDPYERIRMLYGYLQQKTRYVQIHLGIDGYRPHHVNHIHKVKFGDCKDLSVYMVAMLNKVGIQAYPALTMTRDQGWVDPKYPGSQFNHCIVFIPMAEDTLWLECTSDVCSYNDPPAWIEGVNALIVKPDESQLIRTPLSTAESNTSYFNAVAELKIDRSLHIEGKVAYTGNQAITIRSCLHHLDEQKRCEWFVSEISSRTGNAKINSLSIESLENPDTTLSIHFDMDLEYYAQKVGSRLLFEPRSFHEIYFDGEETEKRTMSLLNSTLFTDRDSIEFVLPQNYQLKNNETSDTVSSKFGEFHFQCTTTEDGLIWTSTFVLNIRKVPLEDYPEYFEFMTKVKKESQKKLVLERIKSK